MPEQQSVFRGVVDFFFKLGIYDVVLPFILVFAIIFAILEKTAVLGTEEVGGKKVTKKNLNAISAFVIAFLVIASSRLVSVINQTMAHVVVLIFLGVSFLMLVGVFMGSKEFTLTDYPGWLQFFMVFMFVGIVLILLNALGWLQNLFNFIRENYQTDWVASLILLVFIVALMGWITSSPKEEKKKD
ncbi:MAG: hypothetical protein QW331_00200 [Candidatus Woesearchaeota archaeon]